MNAHPDVPTNPAAEDRLSRLQKVRATILHNLHKAQVTHKRLADRHRLDSSKKFRVGDHVWLLQHNIKTTRPCSKLDYQRFGPYMITGKISDVAFRLDLPPHMHLHPVFHVSLLEPYATSSIPSRLTTPPPPVEFLDGPEFEVAAVLDSKIVRNKLYYLVDWLGYTPNDRTWEPAANLSNAGELVTAFHRQYPCKPGPNTNPTTRETCRRRRGIVS